MNGRAERPSEHFGINEASHFIENLVNMSYIYRLRDLNSRIQEVVKSLNAYNTNERLYDVMIEERLAKKAELQILKNKWDTEYLPALELRQLLRNELYMAENQRQLFERKMRLEIDGMTLKDIELCISHLKDEVEASRQEKHYSTTTDSGASIDSSYVDLQDSAYEQIIPSPNSSTASIGPYITNLEGPCPIIQELPPERKIGHIWSVTSAAATLSSLEEEYASTATNRRSLGSRSCALSVELNALDIELARMKSLMYIPPQLLYIEIRASLNWWKIKYYSEELQFRKGTVKGLRPINYIPCTKHHGVIEHNK